jgi:hypothetical protein
VLVWLVALLLELLGPASAERAAGWIAAAAAWAYLAGIVLMWTGALVPRLRELPAPAAQAEWRPRPGVPVSRRFRSVARVRLCGGELVVVEPDGAELWLGGPHEPTGVRSLVLVRARRGDPAPARAELVDAAGTALAWLDWSAWAGGSGGEDAARAFAAQAGLQVRERVSGSAGDALHLAVPRPAHATGVLAELRWGVSGAALVSLAGPAALVLIVEAARGGTRPSVAVPAAAAVLLTVVPLLGRAVVRLLVDRPGPAS